MNKIIGTVILSFLSVEALAYVVKRGDTLSRIALKVTGKKVWGPDGSLEFLKSLNPHIRNENLIYPGQVIQVEALKAPSGPIQVTLPAEVMAPPETERRTAEDSAEETYSRVSLTPFFSAMSLKGEDKSTGASAVVASKYYTGFDARYFQQWTKDLRSYVFFEAGFISFEPSSNSSKSLTTKNLFLPDFGAGASYRLTPKFKLAGTLSFPKEVFFRGESTRKVRLDSVMVPTFGSRGDYDLFKKEIFTFGVSGSFDYKLAAETDGYDIEAGQRLGVSVYLTQQSRRAQHSYRSELGFYARSQDTSISTLDEELIQISMGIQF